jgi:hypothetical protein
MQALDETPPQEPTQQIVGRAELQQYEREVLQFLNIYSKLTTHKMVSEGFLKSAKRCEKMRVEAFKELVDKAEEEKSSSDIQSGKSGREGI